MTSYWIKTAVMPSFQKLEKSQRCEVVIIGAGMAGILLAYFLTQAGVNTIVLEAGKIGQGHTGHSTGKISALHHLKEYATWSENKARCFFEDEIESVQVYGQLVHDLKIDCDFSWMEHVYQDETVDLEILAKRFPEFKINRQDHQVILENQAQFHPLKFLAHLSKSLQIYEHSRVLEVHGHCVRTELAEIKAAWIVFACQFPFLKLSGMYGLKMHQESGYLSCLSEAGSLLKMYNGDVTMRPVSNQLLFGGLSSMTGKPSSKEQWDKMMDNYFPKARIEQRWTNNDTMTLDHLPYIGRYSLFHPYWLVATGFEKWGMTGSMLASRLLSAYILDKPMLHRSIYAPSRINGMMIKNFFSETGRKMKTYLSHPESPTCSHLGCPLVYNPLTDTYDCPCHGSRFDKEGKCICGPAQKNVNIIKKSG